MIDDKPDDTTQELVANAARTRRRVATDIERLAAQLTPAQLQDRALAAAENSLEKLASRTLERLAQAPRHLASYLSKRPLVGVAVVAGAGVIVWRLAVRGRR